MKKTLAVIALAGIAGAAQADLLAWWSFNNSNNDSDLLNSTGDDNARSNFGHMLDNNDGFDDGFYDPAAGRLYPVSDSFTINPGALIDNPDPGPGIPNAADYGAYIDVSNLVGDNFSSGNSNNWGSFSGTGNNRPDGGTFGGGSLAITGESNNFSTFSIVADLTGFEDIAISWANRGTTTGYNARFVEVSTDGVNFTNIFSDAGALSSSWTVENASAGALLDNASNAILRFTISGAGSSSGNNRFDNIQLTGNVIPAPAGLAALGLGLVAAGRRRR